MATLAPAPTPGRTAVKTYSLARALRAELITFDADPRALLTLRGWGASEPALAGISTFESLRKAAHHDPERSDEVLLALARLGSIYGAGDPLAAQVLLAVLSTGLAAWRRRLADLDNDVNAEEIEQALAAELTIRIRTWRGHRAVAANIVRSAGRNVLDRLLRERSRPDIGLDRISLDTVVDQNEELEASSQGVQQVSFVDNDASRGVEAAASEEINDLFEWVVRAGLLSEEDVNLVRARRLLGFSDAELAAAHGLEKRTLQRRCQRVEARLAEAAQVWATAS